MKTQIKALAKEAGFAKVGIAPVRVYSELLPILKERGQTPFVKPDCNKRIDPFLYMKTAKSAIVCLLPYFSGDDTSVARYARQGDYHAPVKDRLKHIANGLKLEKYRLLVDTGGLPDKYLAYLAGLGWYGANNLFYSEGLGSRFYIGSILTELELEADSPIANKCLNCNLCIKSCPTNALEKPYGFVPERCLSYLTQKESLTQEDEKLLSLSKYTLGCDICQDCCPYNKEIDNAE